MLHLAAIVAGCFAAVVFAIDDDDTEAHWDAFKTKYNKSYDSSEEDEKRRDIFVQNLLHVALHNVKDEHDYDKDLHQYSDMTPREQIQLHCQTKVPSNYTRRSVRDFSVSERQLPDSVDWNDEGMVTPVKDQGSCGSCWAFATAQSVESGNAIAGNGLPTLSEQQLVDCAGPYGPAGCDGGWPTQALQYIQENGGLYSEHCYPYTAMDRQCKKKKSRTCKRVTISGYEEVEPTGDEEALATALAEKGPLAIAIYVSDDMISYGGGIFKDTTYKHQDVNHAVLLTGYGSEDGKDYWTIKNSWGSSWGEDGYIRIRRNFHNHLKVASYAAYPVMNDDE